MLEKLQKIYMETFSKPYVSWYLQKERRAKVKGFKLLIKPTVFHPKYFFSSTYLFDFVSKLDLAEKQFLEIGSGSGLISLLAYQKKAIVTCCDVNEAAVDCTRQNFETNFGSDSKNFYCIKSDVFSFIPTKEFDVIVINPPYFFSEVKHQNQLAWNCGINGEYFTKLFSDLRKYTNKYTHTYMILAENCEIDRIQAIAQMQQLTLTVIEQKKIKWETNYIFKISDF